MAHYQRVGHVPPKRHTQHRHSDHGDGDHGDGGGRLYFEELMGEEGFSSDSSLLYHREIPSAITDSRTWDVPDATTAPNHPLKPRHLKLHELFPKETWADTDVVTGRRVILGNNDVRLSYVVSSAASPLYRNSTGDEIVYIESGTATVETVFGTLSARQGDYVIIPTSTTHRWLPIGDEPLRAYAIEATGHIAPPKRYLSRYGQFLENAPYCERDLHGPSEPLLSDETDVEVLVKHRTSRGIVGTRMTYARHPFDVVGWDGCLYPFTFSVHDFEPITGRVHQPPPVHQVFEGHNFVVCNFVPRKVDYHPLSIPVPYYHSNVDSDEIMFYCGGNYEARKGSGIGQGSVSVHPGGLAHGPQPGAYERSIGVEFFDELAVMVDTFHPLELGEGGLACEDSAYAWTWARRR
ncbi:homogentisate 1,2-dioxygenase [Actinomadura sp. NAK00032]|uniref:homogentisate 1,2-dioxygenase n=1 Tax=Actinomadura sp. NAK00032 TaxID=2742128 RepID=UPI0015904384|nr:cupin domain-containing protein [Actinomadura sp. NAK00032]QKW39578.1 homogentisate 1,2-dioxygenase [Actinomadura sp. NAK00032]